ncbi:MAG: DUF4065 domain-containing protein [Alicyclobacillus sp.]|nr:DUF4065 domain-containing protein [Alicyclobacillus sp.]
MERYCQHCDHFRQSHSEEREETFKVRGEDVTVRGSVAVCDMCGNVVGDEELDGALLTRAYNDYRRRHGLLTSEEIRAIREKYNLSQVAAAKLLGWSPATFTRYEGGALQEVAHDELLRRMRDDAEWVRELYRRNANRLSALQRRRLEGALHEIRESTEVEEMEEIIGKLNKEGEFNPGKLCTVVRLITEKVGKLSKSVFLKYLFYIDFLSLKWYGEPVMGLAYVKNRYGPVPMRHGLLIDYLEACGAIQRDEIERDGEIMGEYVEGLPVDRAEPLDEREYDVLEYVVETLKGMNADRISKFSHEEPAWLETELFHVIPYSKARTLRIG